MAAKVIMPKQGLQMTEGTITKWIKRVGEKVEVEQPLFEMETDKLTIEIVAPVSGTLLKIIRDEGEVVPITEIIAVIGEPGENITGLLCEAGFETCDNNSNRDLLANGSNELQKIGAGSNKDGYFDKKLISNKKREVLERVFISPRAKTLALESNLDISNMVATGPEGLITEKDVKNYIVKQVTSAQVLPMSVPKATPLASRIAAQKDIKLEEVTGTGDRGKIMKADIEAVVSSRSGKSHARERTGKMVPFAGMRKVISDRMLKSLHNSAQANHRMKVDMTEVIRVREKLKAENIKVSFTDILVKVVSKALLDFPIVNSSLTDEGILLKDYVNMGLAVAVENGLIVPVIKDADMMSLAEISTASARLADNAKKGKLKPDEYTDGTFTITNLGMFDVDEFTAIINPPESAILAIGKIDMVPVAAGDNVVIKPIMMLSLTYDHRVIDGAPAAQFIQRVKQILQNPYLLI